MSRGCCKIWGMVETNETKKVNYEAIKMDILKKVNAYGPMRNIESWKEAFPELTFLKEYHFKNEDGEADKIDIDWNERTIAEKLFYVAFCKHSSTEVAYGVAVEVVETIDGNTFEASLLVNQRVTDQEKIWQMWLDGCFTGEDLREEALYDFVEQTIAEGNLKREYVSDVDLDKIKIVKLEVELTP